MKFRAARRRMLLGEGNGVVGVGCYNGGKHNGWGTRPRRSGEGRSRGRDTPRTISEEPRKKGPRAPSELKGGGGVKRSSCENRIRDSIFQKKDQGGSKLRSKH